MKKTKSLGALMLVTMLAIIAFQVYWIQNNYTREKKALETKAGFAFRNALFELQASKINWERVGKDSVLTDTISVFVKDKLSESGKVKIRMSPSQELVGVMSVLRSQLKDSLPPHNKGTKNVVISSAEKSTYVYKRNDSPATERRIEITSPGKGERVLQFFSGIDSLQEAVTPEEVKTAVKKTFDKEKIRIGFEIVKEDDSVFVENIFNNKIHTVESRHDQMLNMETTDNPLTTTIGFLRPQTFTLKPLNTFPYLLKRIINPVLFSLFLIGATILSFVLLYRNLVRQQKLTAIKNEFISNITHELKTPIATVGVAIEALKNFNALQDPQRTKDYLDISSNELQRLSLLVDKVLKLSMFEKREIELKYETVNLQDIVNEVTTSMKLQTEKYNARVSTAAEGNPVLKGDRLHLLSVVFNLLDNALKYSKEEPAIHINLKELPETVELSITDNGIGINEEYKEKLFDKFFRVPAGDTHNAKGYGLGLSYVAHVVHQHKGKIEVDSKPGIGSRFTITLPKQQA